ncbi:hypothetical protein HNR06_003831 [Nocardiopsis arvandica]|uniref:Uncharacterized protein n=1 Tax=Nocardiopsis sinuspersici TaxID=501010 RepID=A0A7Z0BM60_9ACTN|nr:hypothetical protein [Nocardiopsis sinuspersici]
MGSQAARNLIKRVCAAYRTRRSNLHHGNHGPKESTRRERNESRPVTFRPDSAHPYDQRNLSFPWMRAPSHCGYSRAG